MAININTTAASAISDLLSLALQMGVQAQENKWRAEEAEKDRKAKAANIYLNNMLNQENMIIKSILEAEDEANKFGINIEEPISKLHKFQQETATSGIDKLMSLSKDIKLNRINELVGIRSDISKQKGVFNEGERFALTMDENKNSILDTDEITKFQNARRDSLNDPEYVLPEAFTQGATKYLTRKDVRKDQKDKLDLLNAIDIMHIEWDANRKIEGYQEDLTIGNKALAERRKAKKAYELGQTSKMYEHIIKSYEYMPSGAVGKDQLEDADLSFRTSMDIYQDQITRTDKKFRAMLPWGAGQDFKKGAFISNPEMHNENLEKTLETWFKHDPVGPGADTARWLRVKYADYYEDPRNVGEELQKRAFAIEKMFADPEFLAAISTDEGIENAFFFGELGNEEEEDAQIQIFRTTVDMYNLASEWSGLDEGSTVSWLQGLGVHKTENKKNLERILGINLPSGGKKEKDTSQIFQTPDMGSPKQPAFIGMTEEEKKGLLESLYNLDSYV